MTYTKRWELIHLLGSKCVDCGNENFYDLEIDHIFDDGDGDRAIYKDVVGHYLSRPTRAKMRLQILCKKCHEEKHHPPFIPEDFEPEIPVGHLPAYSIILEEVKKLEGERENRKPVFIQSLIANLGTEDNEKWQYDWDKKIRMLLREAIIYESKPGYVNTI